MTETQPNTETLLAELRSLSDQIDELEKQKKTLEERWDEIEHDLLAFHKTTGLGSISGGGMSISFDDAAMRARYDPDKFAEVMKWAAENDCTYIIQRRFSDAKVLELVDAGVALPDGLNLENYCKVSIRRK